MLSFTFSTTAATNGQFSQAIQPDYNFYWLHMATGIGSPKLDNTGVGMNLLTQQPRPQLPQHTRIEQSGVVSIRAQNGCMYTYRLMPVAVMLGLEWPSTQPAEVVAGAPQASVNGTGGVATNAFLGRPVSASSWRLVVDAASPNERAATCWICSSWPTSS